MSVEIVRSQTARETDEDTARRGSSLLDIPHDERGPVHFVDDSRRHSPEDPLTERWFCLAEDQEVVLPCEFDDFVVWRFLVRELSVDPLAVDSGLVETVHSPADEELTVARVAVFGDGVKERD